MVDFFVLQMRKGARYIVRFFHLIFFPVLLGALYVKKQKILFPLCNSLTVQDFFVKFAWVIYQVTIIPI
jgi:hypothetical protein